MKYILLLALLLPLVLYAQTGHYDSLYAQGLISKADYQLLRGTYGGKHASTPENDTLKTLIDHYDNLYNTGQLGVKEHDLLVQQATERYTNSMLIAVPIKYSYDPKEDREKAKGKNTIGSILMVVGTGLACAGIAIHVSNHSPTVGSVISGSLGGVFLIAGIATLSRGAVLRNRADRYERDKQLLGK